MLLLPRDEVQRALEQVMAGNRQVTFSDIVDIAVEFGVSAKALVYRLASISLIKWEAADMLAKDEELAEISRQKRKQEQNTKQSERFNALAVRCLRKGLISRGKFAELINIDRGEIDDHIESMGMMESEGKPVEVMAS